MGRRKRCGDGHLAMTIDPGAGMERYQGIVALTGTTLADAAHEYFDRSEQIPTFIRIAVARHYTGADGRRPANGRGARAAHGAKAHRRGRALRRRRGACTHRPAMTTTTAGGAPWPWPQPSRITSFSTRLPPERLLYRLFHEEGVRAFNASPLAARCNCSRERVEGMLDQFSEDDLAGMADDNVITVTCEFCNSSYKFDADRYLKRA